MYNLEVIMSKKLRIGIIGCGSIANAHANVYAFFKDDVEVVAGADLIPGKARAFLDSHNFTDAVAYEGENACEELCSRGDIDGVSVCVYTAQHMRCAVCALEHGIPVLLEKPFAASVEEAKKVMEAEQKSGKFVSLGFQPRFDINMEMIKKIVQSGVLGKIYYIQTGGGRRHGIPGSTFIEKRTAGAGAMGDIGCYSLDMVLNAIGYPKPLTITGYTSDYFGKNPKYNGEDAERFDVEDFAAAFIRLDGDIILDFRIAWDMHVNTPGDTIFFGTEGALRVPSTSCWNGSVGGPMTIYHDVCGAPTETSIPILKNPPICGFTKKIKSFVDAIRTNGPAPIPTSEILYNQAIIDGVIKSAELGHEIKIEI